MQNHQTRTRLVFTMPIPETVANINQTHHSSASPRAAVEAGETPRYVTLASQSTPKKDGYLLGSGKIRKYSPLSTAANARKRRTSAHRSGKGKGRAATEGCGYGYGKRNKGLGFVRHVDSSPWIFGARETREYTENTRKKWYLECARVLVSATARRETKDGGRVSSGGKNILRSLSYNNRAEKRRRWP